MSIGGQTLSEMLSHGCLLPRRRNPWFPRGLVSANACNQARLSARATGLEPATTGSTRGVCVRILRYLLSAAFGPGNGTYCPQDPYAARRYFPTVTGTS